MANYHNIEYLYSDSFGDSHISSIEMDRKNEPSLIAVQIAVSERWKKKGYEKGIKESIEIINCEPVH